jgi:hypothetical protein
MKNLIIVLALGLVFSGCVSDKVYATGKVIHAGAKAVYIELPVKSGTLENMDNIVVSYDRVRTKVKNQIEDNKKKEGATISEVREK